MHTTPGTSTTRLARIAAIRLMYSPMAQLSGAMDLFGVPGAYGAGVVTCQPVILAVLFHTCSGMKPSGVENARTAFKKLEPLPPSPLRAISYMPRSAVKIGHRRPRPVPL